MKLLTKVLAVMLLTFSFCVTAMARSTDTKQDWYDKNFNFARCSRIVASVNTHPDIRDGINELEIGDLFLKHLQNKLTEPLAKYGYRVKTIVDIARYHAAELSGLTPEVAADKLNEKIAEDCDLHIFATVFEYATGSEYARAMVFKNFMGGRTDITVPDGNFPVVYGSAQIDVFDAKTGQLVWRRVDRRSHMNRLRYDKSSPKSMIDNIFANFMVDFADHLKKQKEVLKR